jgi:hypothetical protein
MDNTRTKIISEIEAKEDIISVKKPFKLYRDRNRRYIRLEISEPITYSILKDRSGGFWPEGDGPSYSASILNISAGGVLFAGTSPVEEGALLVMRMSLQDVEVLDRIIGVAKRVEPDDGEWLIGVEFISGEYLPDYFSAAELDVISEELSSFDKRLRDVLNKYVYYKRLSSRNR